MPGRCLAGCSARAHALTTGTLSPGGWDPQPHLQPDPVRDVLAQGVQPGPAEPLSDFPTSSEKAHSAQAQTKAFCASSLCVSLSLPAPHPSVQPRRRLNFNTLAPGWADSGCCSGEGGGTQAGPRWIPSCLAAACPTHSRVADFSGFSRAWCCRGIGQGPLLPSATGLLLPQQGWWMHSHMCSHREQQHPLPGLCQTLPNSAKMSGLLLSLQV